MTRLYAQAKLQYYPTPPTVTDLILEHLIFPQEGLASLLDPCAGEGVALDTLRRAATDAGSRSATTAIELDQERFTICRSLGFTQVAQANTIKQVKFVKHSADLLWFNPPYDDDPEEGRLEAAFFNRLMVKDRVLAAGGIFIGILPISSFHYLWVHLRDYLEDLRIFRFPDPLYEQFHQVVILGKMRAIKRRTDDPSHHQDTELQLEYERGNAPILGTHACLYLIPGRTQLPKRAVVHAFQLWLAYEAAEKKGWMTRQSYADIFWPKPAPTVQTLLPLRDSHVGVAVAGGLFNNLPIETPEGLILLKGSTVKKQAYARSKYTPTKDDEDKREDIYIEQFEPRVVTTNLTTGQVDLYQLPHKLPNETKK